MCCTGRCRSSDGAVDEYVRGWAFGRGSQIDASQILDLVTKPDGEFVIGGGESREGLLDVGSLEPHQHEAPHRGLLQSPSLPSNPILSQLRLELPPSLPNANRREVPTRLFFPGKNRERSIEYRHWPLLLVRPPDHQGQYQRTTTSAQVGIGGATRSISSGRRSGS